MTRCDNHAPTHTHATMCVQPDTRLRTSAVAVAAVGHVEHEGHMVEQAVVQVVHVPQAAAEEAARARAPQQTLWCPHSVM